MNALNSWQPEFPVNAANVVDLKLAQHSLNLEDENTYHPSINITQNIHQDFWRRSSDRAALRHGDPDSWATT